MNADIAPVDDNADAGAAFHDATVLLLQLFLLLLPMLLTATTVSVFCIMAAVIFDQPSGFC